jgi:hypothetical protein
MKRAVVIAAATLGLVCQGEGAMSYQPNFSTVRKDNVTWLMDGTNTVLCFDPGLIRFGCGRLTPGGYEMFPRPGMVWGPYGWFFPYWGYQAGKPALVSFDAGCTRTQATFRLVTEHKAHALRSDWRMAIGYDPELSCYAYDISTTGTIFDEIPAEKYDPSIWEFFDLFPQGLFDYKTGPQFYRNGVHVDFPDPLWGYIVYQRGGDIGDFFAGKPTWMKTPINRYVTSASGGIRVWRDGYIGVMHSAAGNPMIQLLGDTAAVTQIGQCNWFYDLHFLHDLTGVRAPPPKGFSATARFRIVNFGPPMSQRVMDEAALVGYPPREREQKRYPRYEASGINGFERGVTIDEPDHSRIWQPFHHHVADYHPGVVRVDYHNAPENLCLWVHEGARSGTSALKVATTVEGIAGWQTPMFDRPIVKAGKRYRLSVYIRTEGLEGTGATLGYFPGKEERSYSLSSKPEEARKARPHFAERRVKGTSDWTKVELITPPMEEQPGGTVFEYGLRNCLIQPVLWHEGTGTSWFDDFALEEMGE